MIKNIVFDIGNVLVYFGWKEHFEKFFDKEEIFRKVVAATVADPDWNEIDRGVLSTEEVMDLFVENDPSVEEEIRRSLKSINGMLVQFDYAKGWIKELQSKGYKVYCLSNMSFKACEDCADALDFLPLLDGYILSCEVRENKPGRRIYELLFEKYNLNPEECVFIDDLERNVEAGVGLGMKGIVFKGKESADNIIASL